MAANDNVVYPAILHYAEDGISIIFPDLPGCCPCAHTTQIALKNAKEAMGLHLWGMEQDDEEFPDPTPIEKLTFGKNEIPILIEAFMPVVRYHLSNKFVKLTTTTVLS